MRAEKSNSRQVRIGTTRSSKTASRSGSKEISLPHAHEPHASYVARRFDGV